MTKPNVLSYAPYFGSETIEDEPAGTTAERAGRCYELTAYALLFGSAPLGTVLVHGTVQGNGPRIGHAWLELPDGSVWEPMYHLIYLNWTEYASAVEERRYTSTEARRLIMSSGHWGCWHDTAGVTRDYETGALQETTGA